MEAFVLCAGKQLRQGSPTSKMMVDINGIPAISHTLNTVISVIPEDLVTIISSELFPDLNHFIVDLYPKAKIIIDKTPGRGTAHTLSTSLPWKTDHVFVTEGDIYYLPHLITDQIQATKETFKVAAIMGVTPQTTIASTHRGVELKPRIDIYERGKSCPSPTYRNIGAHIFKADVVKSVNLENTTDVIDVIRFLYTNGFPVIANVYLSTFLHLADLDDAVKWNEYFKFQNS